MYSEKAHVRKLQTLGDGRSFLLIIPKNFTTELGLTKGDYVRCSVDGTRIILEKAEV